MTKLLSAPQIKPPPIPAAIEKARDEWSNLILTLWTHWRLGNIDTEKFEFESDRLILIESGAFELRKPEHELGPDEEHGGA